MPPASIGTAFETRKKMRKLISYKRGIGRRVHTREETAKMPRNFPGLRRSPRTKGRKLGGRTLLYDEGKRKAKPKHRGFGKREKET